MSIVIGDNLSNQIFTSDENDSVFGLEGKDIINSGGGNDAVFGGGGNDILRGFTGDDVLIGGEGNDIIDGGDGCDILEGGAGADILEGGAGADTFVVDVADGDLVDFITDFTAGEDTLFIQGTGSPNATVDYDAHTGIVFVNGQALVQLQPGLNIDEGNDFFLA